MKMNFENIFPLGLGLLRHKTLASTNWILAYAAAQGINYYEACSFYLKHECESRLAYGL